MKIKALGRNKVPKNVLFSACQCFDSEHQELIRARQLQFNNLSASLKLLVTKYSANFPGRLLPGSATSTVGSAFPTLSQRVPSAFPARSQRVPSAEVRHGSTSRKYVTEVRHGSTWEKSQGCKCIHRDVLVKFSFPALCAKLIVQ
jgi:hypothetical protein